MDDNNIPTIKPISDTNEKISPIILSIIIILLFLQLVAVIFPFIVQKRNIRKKANIKPSLIFYLICSVIELCILITLIVFNRTFTSLNNKEINLIFYSILSYIILQTINLFSNIKHDINQTLENFNGSLEGKTAINYSDHMNNYKKGFNLFTSIYMVRMVGTFLSVHIFSRILFNNKLDLDSNTLKIILDILIPFFILFLFRSIERFVFFKKTDQPIDKKFWKQLFLGNWNHNEKKSSKSRLNNINNNNIQNNNKSINKSKNNYSLHRNKSYNRNINDNNNKSNLNRNFKNQ